MKVKELIKELQKQDPEKSVYFRDKRNMRAIQIVTATPNIDWAVELTNEECLPRERRAR